MGLAAGFYFSNYRTQTPKDALADRRGPGSKCDVDSGGRDDGFFRRAESRNFFVFVYDILRFGNVADGRDECAVDGFDGQGDSRVASG